LLAGYDCLKATAHFVVNAAAKFRQNLLAINLTL
jgi:hypothetical protein